MIIRSLLISQRKIINRMSKRQKEKKEDKLAVPLLTFDDISINNNVFVSVDILNDNQWI